MSLRRWDGVLALERTASFQQEPSVELARWVVSRWLSPLNEHEVIDEPTMRGLLRFLHDEATTRGLPKLRGGAKGAVR